MTDRYMTMQLESAQAFDNSIRSEPGLPNFGFQGRAKLVKYAGELAALAKKMKAEAAQAKAQGQEDLALWLIRIQLSTEETGELAEAVATGDLAHALNELTDLSYVTDGHYLTMGVARLKEPAYAEVHRANMSKCVDGRGVVDASGRHVKGPDYRKPDLAKVLEKGS